MIESQDPGDRPTIQLVTSAQAGDREALEQLFERYLPRVKAIVRARLGSTAGHLNDYDDLAQEAVLAAFAQLDSFEIRSEARFRDWMARIVQNTIIESHRKRNAQKRDPARLRRYSESSSHTLSALVLAGDEPSPSAVYRGKELEERIAGALMELDEHYREVIILRQLCEMSFAEIGEILGYGRENTVRTLFCRALKKLKTQLEA